MFFIKPLFTVNNLNKFKLFKSIKLSLGSVPGLLLVNTNNNILIKNSKSNEYGKNINQEIEISDILNADYSWISSDVGNFVNNQYWFLFTIFWFFLIITITYINVGLTSLLFLLEVGLLTPIASMVLLGLVPISSILYLLNAITMEAVVGVIIAMCYCKDWKYKDFTKYELLEGSFFFLKKIYILIKKKNKNSWSYFVKLLKIYIFNSFYIINKLSNNKLIFILLLILLLFVKNEYIFNTLLTWDIYFNNTVNLVYKVIGNRLNYNKVYFLNIEYGKVQVIFKHISENSKYSTNFFSFKMDTANTLFENFKLVNLGNLFLHEIVNVGNLYFFDKLPRKSNYGTSVTDRQFTNPKDILQNLNILNGKYFNNMYNYKNNIDISILDNPHYFNNFVKSSGNASNISIIDTSWNIKNIELLKYSDNFYKIDILDTYLLNYFDYDDLYVWDWNNYKYYYTNWEDISFSKYYNYFINYFYNKNIFYLWENYNNTSIFTNNEFSLEYLDNYYFNLEINKPEYGIDFFDMFPFYYIYDLFAFYLESDIPLFLNLENDSNLNSLEFSVYDETYTNNNDIFYFNNFLNKNVDYLYDDIFYDSEIFTLLDLNYNFERYSTILNKFFNFTKKNYFDFSNKYVENLVSNRYFNKKSSTFVRYLDKLRLNYENLNNSDNLVYKKNNISEVGYYFNYGLDENYFNGNYFNLNEYISSNNLSNYFINNVQINNKYYFYYKKSKNSKLYRDSTVLLGNFFFNKKKITNFTFYEKKNKLLNIIFSRKSDKIFNNLDYDLNLSTKNTVNAKLGIENLSIRYQLQNILIDWGSKNKISIYNYNSKNLPWFDIAESDYFLYDKSAYQIFNNSISFDEFLILENTKLLNNYIKNSLNILDDIYNDGRIKKRIKKRLRGKKKKLKKRILKIKKFRRRPNIHKKSPIWKSKVNWIFNNDFEKLYNYNYKSISTIYFENKIYLKRVSKLNNILPNSSSRLSNKYGISNFDNSLKTVYSYQSKNFGLSYINNYVNYVTYKLSNYRQTNAKVLNNKKKLFSILENFNKQQAGLGNYNLFIKNHNKKLEIGINTLGKKNKNSRYLKFKNFLILKNNKNNKLDEISDNFIFKKKFFNLKSYNSNINIFDKKLKLFWSPNTLNSVVLKNYHFDKKTTSNLRFLSTFKNMLIKKEYSTSNTKNRIDSFGVYNDSILNIIGNALRTTRLKNVFLKNNTVYSSDGYNKLIFDNNKKYTINEDREIYSNNFRVDINMPHSIYGLVWDEYLKSTYGFNLNFLNFLNKIENVKLYKDNLKNISFFSNYFEKNIENNLITFDNYTGITKDSEIGSIVTSRVLPRVGFFREITSFDNLDEILDKKYNKKRRLWHLPDYDTEITNRKKKYKKYEKRWHKKVKNKFLKNKKIKKYFKKNLLKITIEKNKLLKKSISYIKKYNETPVGLKYNKTVVSNKIPYFKRKLWIKNEYSYRDLNFFNSKQWLDKKNKDFNLLNRAYFTKKFHIKKNKEKRYFKKKKLYKKYLKIKGLHLNTFYDFTNSKVLKKSKILKKRKKLFLIYDRNDDFLNKNKNKDNVKRNLKRVKPKILKFKKRFKKIRNLSLSTLKKHRYKHMRNLKLFFKTKIYVNDTMGGFLPNSNGISNNYNKSLILKNIYLIRHSKNFGDYYIFEHPTNKIIKSGENYLNLNIKNIEKQNYKNNIIFNSIKNNKLIYNINDFLKFKNNDLSYYENTLKFKLKNTKKISTFYRLNNYNHIDFLGKFKTNLGFWEDFNSYGVIDDFYFKNNPNNIFYKINFDNSDNLNINSNLEILSSFKSLYSNGIINNTIIVENIFLNVNSNNLSNKQNTIIGKVLNRYKLFDKISCALFSEIVKIFDIKKNNNLKKNITIGINFKEISSIGIAFKFKKIKSFNFINIKFLRLKFLFIIFFILFFKKLIKIKK